MPDSTFKKGWDFVIAIVILYSSIVTPYNIAFVEVDNVSLDIASDCILFVDVIINFFSAYVDSEDNVIKNRKVRKCFFKFIRKLS
jgi:hypothetical protein